MRGLRATRRLAGLLLLSGALEILFLAGLLPARALGRGERWRSGCFRAWGRGSLALLGVRVEVEGSPPRPPFFLVTNHLSYLDIALLARETGATFVAREEVARWPVVGWLARSVGSLFLDRGERRDVIRIGAEIEALLAAGRGVVLFAEGTSTSGAGVAPFRPALLEPAARAGQPVHFATLRYRVPPGEAPVRTAVAWWGDMTFAPHLLRLATLRGVEAQIAFGREPIRDSDRKSLAERLQREVASRFLPLEA
ncbi:MAG: lysophospholipid acyltransferase family protein [Planctomycetota bacterium]